MKHQKSYWLLLGAATLPIVGIYAARIMHTSSNEDLTLSVSVIVLWIAMGAKIVKWEG